MNVTELFHADGRSAAVFYCGKCRIVHRTQAIAEQCCAVTLCEVCGAPAEQYRTVCSACGRAREVQREAERFAKAEKVTDWDGWIFWDGTGFNEGFFSSVEDLEEYLAGDGMQFPPAYVWTCKKIQLVSRIFDRISDYISENAYEDWDTSHLSGLPEFKAAVEAFEAANKDQVSWEPSYKQALLLEPIAAAIY